MNIKKIVLFIVITYGLSWSIIASFLLAGGQWNTPSAMGMLTIYMFTPMMSALIVQKAFFKRPVKGPMGISFGINTWFVVAWLLPPIVAFATFGVSLLFPSVEFSPGMEGIYERFGSMLSNDDIARMKEQAEAMPFHPIWMGLIQGLIAGITINAIAGFGEELGWRGFLQNELAPLGFWKSSVLIGFIWGLWHAPAIYQGHNYPQHPVVGIFMMIIWCMLLGPVISYIRLKAKSVIAASIFHGSLNATVGLAIIAVKGGSDLVVGVTGLSGFIVLAITLAGIGLYRRFNPEEELSKQNL
jgi:membrane protease YdiL (CAAX protease family)